MKKKRYGLIGKTLTHTFSKKYFENKFLNEGITDCSYDLFEMPDLSNVRKIVTENKLTGFNVTIPFKETIIPYLDEIDDAVKKIGSVNCVSIVNGKWIGYNTDVYGFSSAIKPFLKNNHQKALILGRGGSAKAVAYVLKNLGIDYLFVSRKNEAQHNQLSYAALNETVLQHFHLIANCTPVGMFPNVNECPDIPYEFLTAQHFLFDMIYNPEKTLFLSKAEKQGAMIQNGLNMLKLQAEKSWEIWSGVE